MQYLKASTSDTLKIGPFVDSSDGVTPETGLSIAQADVRLSKNGGDFAQKNEASSATHDEQGYYDVPINATDSDTAGRLVVAVDVSGALPIRQEYEVLPAQVYDSLVTGSDTLQSDVIQAAGNTVSEDGAGHFQVKDESGNSVAIASAQFDPSSTPVEILDTGGTAGKAVEEVVNDVWDEILTGSEHTTVNSAGARLRNTAELLNIRTDSAQGGGADTITLDANASSIDGYYNRTVIRLIGGTGATQSRAIVDYDGTTKVATVDEPWDVVPDDTTEYQLTIGRTFLAQTDHEAAQVDANAVQWAGSAVNNGGTSGHPVVDAQAISDSATAADDVESYIGNLQNHTAQSGDTYAALPANFSDLTITATDGYVTAGTVNDKSGYSISGTKNTLDDLNDIAQADILSDGTPFDGANIDASISTRSSHGDPDPNGYIDVAISSRSDFDETSDVVDANFVQVLGTGVTETSAGNLAGGFEHWYDVGTPSNTMNSDPLGTSMRGTDNASTHDDPDPNGYLDTSVSSRSSHSASDVTGGTTVAQAESNIRGVDSDDLAAISGQIDGLNDPTSASIADAVLEEIISDHEGTAGSLADYINQVFDLQKADVYVDTDTSPYSLVWAQTGTADGTADVLVRKYLYDVNGTGITDLTTRIAIQRRDQ